MANEKRVEAARAYTLAVRTGEYPAAARAKEFLADDVILARPRGELEGRDVVAGQIRGVFPFTPTYIFAGWSEPIEEGDQLRVNADFPSLGAAPTSVSLLFSFDAADHINRVEESMTMAAPNPPTKEIPVFVRGIISGALANGTPMV